MNYVSYCVIYGLIVGGMIAAGTCLIVTEHYGWAWLPWMFLFCVRFNPPQPQSHEGEK